MPDVPNKLIEPPLNDNKLIGDSLATDELYPSKKYNVKLLCNESIIVPKAKFTNFVKSENNPDNNKIIELSDLDGKQMEINDLPGYEEKGLYIGKKNTLSRINTILCNYISAPLKDGEEEGVNKRRIKSKASGTIIKDKNDIFRYYFRVDEDDTTIEIILMDPNHLFATELFDKQYEEHKRNGVNIKLIIGKRVFKGK